MADEKPSTSGTGFSGITSSADSSLLSFLSNMNGNSPAGADASALSASGTLNLSSLLPTSGANTNSSLAPAATALPIDTDIDQLMKSLGGSVDSSKVSNEDIDKLLGSLNAHFPSDLALSGPSTNRATDTDPLASLSRDLGIDLSTSVSLPSTNAIVGNNAALRGVGSSAFTAASSSHSTMAAGTHNQQQLFMSQQDMSVIHSDPITRTQAHSGLHMSSMPASPALSGISGDAGMQRQAHISQLQQGMHYRPSIPQAHQHPGSTQQRALNASQSVGQVGPNQTAMSHSSPGRAASQRPPRPQTPMQVSRSGSKQRASFSEAASSPGLSGPQRSNPGSRAESPSMQNRPPRQLSAQQGHGDQNLQGQHGTQQAGGPAGMHMRPQQRPQAGFGPGLGPGSVDPSRWLVETMSKLPADHQEKLAGLFRGLQSKTIDFPTFMRDAKVIMGAKFQDLLVLMHSQGARHVNMPTMQQQSPSSLMRPNNPFSVSNGRPGMPLMSSASPPMPISQGIQQRSTLQHSSLAAQGATSGQNTADGSRNNVAFMRQFLASQQAHSTSNEPHGNIPATNDFLSVPLNGQTATAAVGSSSQDASVGSFPAGTMGNVTPETLIARWRQIILNPNIPAEQLARLSMQLSSFGNLIASSTGPMSHMPEETRNQQFMQITKLQALISQRQFARGPQTQSSINSQPASRPGSPKTDSTPKDTKRKPARPKKRASESRQSGSPAPGPSSKRQKTVADIQAGDGVEALAAHLALAGGRGNAALMTGMTASQNDGQSTPASYVDDLSDDANGSSVDYEDEDDAPINSSLIRGGISRTESIGTGAYSSDAEQDSITKGKYRQGGRPRDKEKERTSGPRDAVRKPKEKREKDRGGAGGGGDAFSIDDVIGYTGVDLREESEIILGSGIHQQQNVYRARGSVTGYERGAGSSTRVIDGVEVSRDRSLEAGIANSDRLEELVSRICKRLGIRAVSADAVPYLSLALQERLRSFMEVVSAAAYHRTRTQTLPPPPLDPNTRLPLYKITPHLDVKKQLVVLERMDKMREQNRQRLLVEREQNNTLDPQQQHADSESDRNQSGGKDERRKMAGAGVDQVGSESVSGTPAISTATELASASNNIGTDQVPGQATSTDPSDASRAAAAASGAKRGRKRDDSTPESAAYTSKNMPEEIRNKISNQTALRAAGGVRKSWMNASPVDWLGGASAGKASTRLAGGSKTTQQQQQPDSLDLPTKRTASTSSASGSMASPIDTSGNIRPSLGHRRNRSSASNASDFDNVAVVSPAPDGAQTPLAQSASLRPPSAILPHRPTALSAPLLVTVRDCLFSLERERLGSARAGRGSGDRVLIQAYNKYIHDL